MIKAATARLSIGVLAASPVATFVRWSVLALSVLPGCFSPAHVAGVGESSTTDGMGTTGVATTASESGSSGLGTSDGGSSSGVDTSTAADSSTGDATDTGTSTGEPTTCSAATPFGAPTLVFELASELHEDHAWLSPDELTVYVSSNRDDALPGYDVYVGVRDDVDAPFGELALLTGSAGEDRRPALTADGLTLYVASSPIGALDYDIMVATRDNPLAELGALAPVAVVNSDVSDSAPWISADGSTLWFDSQRTGLGDIYRTQRSGDGPFAEPEPVDELNTPSVEAAPVPSADGLAIWFASNRVGGTGDLDVWTATRSSTDEGFDAPTNVPEVGSDAIDWPTWVSPDGCRLYLASRRPDGDDYDLWIAERSE